MNYNHLRVFIDVAETLSFSVSAQNLSIAQPAVSRTIKTLEEDLGLQLFTRNNRKVFLTTEGRKLHQNIAPLFKNIEESILSLKNNENKIAGDIRIGALVEFAEFKLLPLINKLNQNYPDLSFKLEMKGDRELREMFLEGKLDVYLGIKPMDAENILSFKCFDQKSLLLTNSKTKQKINSLEEISFVAYREMDPLILSYLKKYYPNKSYQNIKKVFIANSHKAMVDYLSHHENCFGILPELSSSVSEAIKKKRLKTIKNEFLNSPIYISYWDHEFISPSLKVLVESIKKKS